MQNLNLTTAVFLMNDAVRCIKIAYEGPMRADADWKDQSAYKGEHLKLFKSLDSSLKAGDYVTVPTDTRWKLTVVRVIEADVDFDIESQVQMGWIVGRVERQDYDRILADEAEIITTVQDARKKQKREELRTMLVKGIENDLSGLRLVNTSAVPSLASPPPYTGPDRARSGPSDQA